MQNKILEAQQLVADAAKQEVKGMHTVLKTLKEMSEKIIELEEFERKVTEVLENPHGPYIFFSYQSLSHCC